MTMTTLVHTTILNHLVRLCGRARQLGFGHRHDFAACEQNESCVGEDARLISQRRVALIGEQPAGVAIPHSRGVGHAPGIRQGFPAAESSAGKLPSWCRRKSRARLEDGRSPRGARPAGCSRRLAPAASSSLSLYVRPSFFQAPGVSSSLAPEIIVKTRRNSKPQRATSETARRKLRYGSRGKSFLSEFQIHRTAREHNKKRTAKKEMVENRIRAMSESVTDGIPATAAFESASNRSAAKIALRRHRFIEPAFSNSKRAKVAPVGQPAARHARISRMTSASGAITIGRP